MKKNIQITYVLLLSLILFIGSANAQSNYCWNTINTTTTDWKQYNNGSKNNWDWTLQGLNHPIYLQNNLNTQSMWIELPYFCTNTAGCGNNNTYPYELIGNNNEDIKPENGWELVTKAFGYPNSSPNAHDGYGIANPYFVLYNRYTGRVKIYMALIGEHTTANSARIKVDFYKNGQLTRALYSHANPVSETLAEFNNTMNFKSLNNYINIPPTSSNLYYWIVSEIQTAYDPCTCYLTESQNGLNSSISLEVKLINTITLTATIEGTLTQNLISGGAVQGESNGKTSLLTDGAGVVDAAVKGYSTWNDYSSTVNSILDKSNDDYKNKIVKDWFGDYVQTHPQYQGINNINKQLLWNAIGKTDDSFKKELGMSTITQYQDQSGFKAFKTIASALPYIGTAISVIDFILNGGSNEQPSAPSAPVVFDVSLKVNGQLLDDLRIAEIKFLNPGSPQLNSNSTIVPTYNNILGVFNILKPPL